MIITTSRKPVAQLVQEAMEIGRRYGITYIDRGNLSLSGLLDRYGAVLVLSRERLSCHTAAGELFFHPNMAAVRIKLMRQGKTDRMVRVMGLKPGDNVLDCTAGFCADSLVAQMAVGQQGRVVALEKSLPVYLVANHGLRHYSGPERLRELARAIELRHADFREYLEALPPGSFDVVYFDPMFSKPILEAAALRPLRPLAFHRPLTREDIALASRVARRRVVVKQHSSFDFAGLGLSLAPGSEDKKIAYGVLDIKESNDG